MASTWMCYASIKQNIIISIARAFCEYSQCFLRFYFLSFQNSLDGQLNHTRFVLSINP